MKTKNCLFIAVCAFLLSGGFAFAQEAGAADKAGWGLYFADAVTPVMREIRHFHEWVLLPVITAIVLLVLALLIYVCFRFRARRSPQPSKTSHNVLIETVWTLVPVLILMIIAAPSIRLLLLEDKIPPADVTVKAIGYQWYWGYEYPEAEVAEYSSYMLCQPDAGAENGFKQECVDGLKAEKLPHKLATDTFVVAPVNKNVRLLVTSQDVIHSWAMPAFGVKIDAIPGRVNQTWFRAEKEGTYYGQCSELCGVNHAFMPITVKVVSQEAYDAWVKAAKDDIDAANKIIADYALEKTVTADVRTAINGEI